MASWAGTGNCTETQMRLGVKLSEHCSSHHSHCSCAMWRSEHRGFSYRQRAFSRLGISLSRKGSPLTTAIFFALISPRAVYNSRKTKCVWRRTRSPLLIPVAISRKRSPAYCYSIVVQCQLLDNLGQRTCPFPLSCGLSHKTGRYCALLPLRVNEVLILLIPRGILTGHERH